MAGWSLRARLLVMLVGLLAGVCVLVGTVTGVVLHHFQVGQLDAQLTAAGGRFRGAFGTSETGQPRPRLPIGHGLFPPGQSAGTLAARAIDGQITRAGVLDAGGSSQLVPEAQQQVLATLPADGQPRTRDLGSLGRYRLVANRTPEGDTLITGLPMGEVDAAHTQLVLVEIGVGLLALLLAAGVGAKIVEVTLRPLTRVAATARRVSELPLHAGEVTLPERVPEADTDPRTEVGRVGAALNRMLDHVVSAFAARQASETRLRRFVADASHELRTPLAVIRGYTELTRRHRAGTPPDVARALDGIDSAAGRMTGLVEDLLLLARLDAGRPLVHVPVDLTPIVIEAVREAHVAAPDRQWRLALPDEPVSVTGDPARLHQIMANLLANARVHTPPGTTVSVTLSDECAGAEAVLRICDDGPGIPADLQPRIFERFTRGDASRSRAAGSSGLGLSIVAAVVGAHRGQITVASVPGHTEFAVRLPALNGLPQRAAATSVDS